MDYIFFRNRVKLFLIIIAFFLTITDSIAQPELQIADLGDLKLESGEILHECKVGYRLFGSLNETKSNAVLYPTWFGGTSEEIQFSIGASKLVDSSKYFIIAVDALGNGISTSPSNYAGGVNEFPDISIRDMVNSQYKLITEHLGLKSLFAIIGGSMGSMQVFEWMVAYPEFMQKAIPYSPSPFCTPYDLLRWNIYLHIIESGKASGMPLKEIHKTLNMLTYHSATTPEERNSRIKRSEFSTFLETFNREPSKIFTLENWKALIKAMIKHDITRNFENSIEKTAKAIKSEVFIIISETDQVLIPKPAIEFATLLNCKLLRLTNNCGHLALGCDMEKVSAEISQFLDGN